MSHSSSHPAKDPPGVEDLPEDDRHRVLSNRRRRILLGVLADRSLPIGVEEVAASVASQEDAFEDGRREAVERVAIALHHKHVPQLEELGILEYDRAANRILHFRCSVR